MAIVKGYDTELQMFTRQATVNTEYLCFLRALGEQGHLEHPVEPVYKEEDVPASVRATLARARMGVLLYGVED